MAAPPTIVFDLDGTLVDSVPDLRASLNRLAAARGLAVFDVEEVTSMVGDGAAALVRRAFAARGRDAGPAEVAAFLDDYGAQPAVLSAAYPGAGDTLAGLASGGWRIAVCTNKPGEPARDLLAALDLLRHVHAVVGGDAVRARKPDPGHLLAAIAAAGGSAATSVMVGDHANDVAAADAAGVPCIFAAWGYGPAAMGAAAAARAACLPDVPPLAAALTR